VAIRTGIPNITLLLSLVLKCGSGLDHLVSQPQRKNLVMFVYVILLLESTVMLPSLVMYDSPVIQSTLIQSNQD
jgi:hypothetical protein